MMIMKGEVRRHLIPFERFDRYIELPLPSCVSLPRPALPLHESTSVTYNETESELSKARTDGTSLKPIT